MHPCPCCGDRCGAVYTSDPDDMCDNCLAANCTPDGDCCDVQKCEHCGEYASFMTDGCWHSNCEDDCESYTVEPRPCWAGDMGALKRTHPEEDEQALASMLAYAEDQAARNKRERSEATVTVMFTKP